MSNEAAERLLDLMTPEMKEWAERHVNAALADERRATVERIRAALTDKRIDLAGYDGDQIVANPTGDLLFVEEVLAILDAEAQR